MEVRRFISLKECAELTPELALIKDGMRFAVDTIVENHKGNWTKKDRQRWSPQFIKEVTLSSQCLRASKFSLQYIANNDPGVFDSFCTVTSYDFKNKWEHVVGVVGCQGGEREQVWYGFSPANFSEEINGFNRERDIFIGNSIDELIENMRLVDTYYFEPNARILVRPYPTEIHRRIPKDKLVLVTSGSSVQDQVAA